MRIGKYLESALGMFGTAALLLGLLAAPTMAQELGEIEIEIALADTCTGSNQPCGVYTCDSGTCLPKGVNYCTCQ